MIESNKNLFKVNVIGRGGHNHLALNFAAILTLIAFLFAVTACTVGSSGGSSNNQTKTYTIDVLDIDNGTIKADKTSAEAGTEITLTVTPDSGYKLKTQTLSVTDTSSNVVITTEVTAGTTYTFTMPESDVTVSATFEKSIYTVTINELENGTVTADKTSASLGDIITLTITPNSNYYLGSLDIKDASGKLVSQTEITAGTTYTFAMPESSVTVTATFTETVYSIICLTAENGAVNASMSSAAKDATITLTVTPDSNYALKTLTVKDASDNVVETTEVTASTSYSFTMPESNVTVSATFVKLYTVKIADITNGSVTANETSAEAGTEITLTISANSGYAFKSLTVTNESDNTVETTEVTASTSYSFTMPESNVTVSATFVKLYTVRISDLTNGSVTANETSAEAGTEITLTVTPDTNYYLGPLTVTDENSNTVTTTEVTAGTTYTFTMPESNVTIRATFSNTAYNVTISSTTNGSIESSLSTAVEGALVTLTVTPGTNYNLGSLILKDSSSNTVTTTEVTVGTTYTFIMPASNVTVTATFAETVYNVNISDTTNGTLTPNLSKAASGTTIILTVLPASGYGIKSFTVTNESTSELVSKTEAKDKTYSFTMPASDVTVKIEFALAIFSECDSNGFVGVTGATLDGKTTLTPSGGTIGSSSNISAEFSDLYVCDHQVTQAEYETYCKYGTTISTNASDGDNYPAAYISWYDAIVYCNLRSIAEGFTPVYSITSKTDSSKTTTEPRDWTNVVSEPIDEVTKYCGPSSSNNDWNNVTVDSDANGYRLPTSAEWEYIARGGNNWDTYTYSGSDTQSEVAYTDSNAKGSTVVGTATVKTLKANSLGIYDMSGNVWEWCQEKSGSARVNRGGSVRDDQGDSHCVTYTSSYEAYKRAYDNGFRVVRTNFN